jgi:glycosyltransferase involved in cell wall biosynthesis
MHIVINAFSARRGGGKTYLQNILKHFPLSSSVKITLLVSKGFMIDAKISNIFIKQVLFPVHNPIFRFIWETLFLPFYLRKEKTDIFFCPGGIIPKFSYGKWRTVTMFRNMIPFDISQRKKYPLGYMRLRNWLLCNSMSRSMRTADQVIFISAYAKSVVENLIDIKSSIVIPHGVSENFKDVGQFLNRPNFLPSEPYVLYPSIIDTYKSQVEVVTAVSILKTQGVKVPIILFVGEKIGQYGDKVGDLIKQLNLEEDVLIFGSVDYSDMPALYHFSEFVIFASQSENCPNILLEALASGCAILCSNSMPMPEFANNDVEYFNPCDAESIASKINKFITYPEIIKRKKNQALRNTSVNDWRKVAKKTWHAILQ